MYSKLLKKIIVSYSNPLLYLKYNNLFLQSKLQTNSSASLNKDEVKKYNKKL